MAVMGAARFKFATREGRASAAIGRDISLWRRALGISQADMARRCRVSVTTVSRLENGDSNVSMSTLLKVADVLGALTKIQDALNPIMDDRGAALVSRSVKERVRG